ncbi:TetR/AcrR family transcriptional regulator [Gordonia sp. (in: high G+C Gram-positive bacteria)]|uniref:TetR/AcrR family transcriptional regulator n=1 Tax=Gordonia sp. (in: high G+C Gram-positive bacteria) TaxID=84139 RepID=UPI001D5FC463|nr:TetR/AcrR family transcriptional regulator [Gordonia sp. (in: high G+C Gram-positive bacteria)]MCB1295510.1 TetR/AcrR family transcriptional regulator [Gordonia sp. (in: high G+C Gram-positive bacteria)]HMS74605.1 TetR/AcrR family transcriptional regulator [Gordonia sp. (in: high G+C Gram-positive bacteria)]HQV21075.1 TetR/AcrR family transcriptional regulator [Gordonia sp. (in: high G+C Gram-positive bacteria)]
MPRMPVEDRRKALVEAAFDVIAEHGVENATTRTICSHAGMPLASFHYAFDSRDDLLRRVMLTIAPMAIDSWVATMVPPADAPVLGRAGLDDHLRANLGMFRSVLESGPGRMRACVSLALYAQSHPPLAAAAKEMFEHLYTIAERSLIEAADNMGVHWLSSPRQLAQFLVGTTCAATLVYLATADTAAVDNIVDGSLEMLMSHVADN